MFSLSDATEHDIPAIRDLAERTWWTTYADILSAAQIRYMLDSIYGDDTLRADIRSGNQRYVLLHDAEACQGFVAYGRRPHQPAVFRIWKLYVLPASQGKGYGRALVGEIKRRALRYGVRVLELNVNRYNSARKFYESNGFTVVREEDVAIGPYVMNDYVMQLSF